MQVVTGDKQVIRLMQIKPRYSLLFLFGMTALVAVFATKYKYRPYHPRETGMQTTAADGGIATISYGIRRHKTDSALDKLDFVVIQFDATKPGTSQLSHTRFSSASDRYHNVATIEFGDLFVSLPADNQLHELVDGEYQTTTQRITLAVFDKYRNSKTKNPSIDELLSSSAEPKGPGG